MMIWFHRLRKDKRGVAAVEFALAAPLLLVLLCGIIELSNFMMAARRVSSAAHTAADLISQETDITSAELSELFQASRKVIEPFDEGLLTIGAASVRFDDGTGDPTLDWTGSYNGGSVSNPLTTATGMGAAGESVLIVTSTYAYTPVLGLVMTGTYTLSETAVTRPRYIDYVGLY